MVENAAYPMIDKVRCIVNQKRTSDSGTKPVSFERKESLERAKSGKVKQFISVAASNQPMRRYVMERTPHCEGR